MKPFINILKYQEDKSLGINLCYEVNEKCEVEEHKLLIMKYKEIYINICLIWINIAIGIKTKPREE